MATSTHAEYMASYKAVSAKLKKRFMRRSPNVGQASEQYNGLGKAMAKAGDYPHAAFCCKAAARCERALEDPTAEADLLVQGAQLFMQAEAENQDLDFGGFEENMTEAIDCYHLAINIYVELQRTSFAATLHIELANALLSFDKLEEAERQYHTAADLLMESPLPATSALHKAMKCSIRRHCLEKALSHVLGIAVIIGSTQDKVVALKPPKDHFADLAASEPPGAYRALIAECEITTVLLLLLVAKPFRKTHTLGPTLERYKAIDYRVPPPDYIKHETFLGIQSVVLAVDSQDADALKLAQTDMWFLLGPLQNDLLNMIVTNTCQ